MPENASNTPDLSVVIPMCNAADTVGELAQQILSLPNREVQIVAIDDASTDGSPDALRALGSDAVTVIELESNHGAGYARNIGFARATGRYTLFFDADDEIHLDALESAISQLDSTGADLAMMPYSYRRGHSTEYTGMNSFDEVVWRSYMSGMSDRVAPLTEVPRLLGFSNYPWNKVLRTDRYQDAGLRFGEVHVHNDILGHWMSLLLARKIVLLDEQICTHIVGEGGANLSNRMGRERLALFDALDETYDMISGNPELRNRYSHHYWDFALRVTDWALSRISPEVVDEARYRLQTHLLRMSIVEFMRIRERRDPSLANRITSRALA